MPDIATIITQINFTPDKEHNIHFEIILPLDYYDVVPQLDKTQILEKLKTKGEDIKKQFNIGVKYDWNDHSGLWCVRLEETDGTSMLLNGNAFTPTNILNSQQALSLLSVGQEYLMYIMLYSKRI